MSRSWPLALLLLTSCSPKPAPPPAAVPTAMPTAPVPPPKPWPDTRRDPTTVTMHGVSWADPYQWLEDEKNADVQAWMTTQDTYTRAELAKLPGRDALVARFKQLFYVDSISPPIQRGTRVFYERTHATKDKSILYWREGDTGEEKILLDPNTWENVSLGGWVPSWDGKYLAYRQNPNHADEAVLHVMEIATGKELTRDTIPGAKYASVDWTPDAKGFYYEWLPTDPAITIDARPGYTELRYHQLGTDPAADPIVHPRTGDPTTFLDGSLSRDGRYLFLYIQHGWSANDVYIRDLKKDKAWRPFIVGKDASYTIDAWKDQLYIYTNEGAPHYRLFKTPASALDRAGWKEIIKEDATATLNSSTIVGGQLALDYLKDAHTELRIATLDGAPVRTVALPGLGTSSTLIGLQDRDTAYFQFSSFTVPRQVYKTSLSKGTVDLWAKVELPIDASPYVVDQVWYPSKDGTKVPMFLVHKKDAVKNGANPTLLYGYGGFNVPMTPSFRSSLYPWLEAGGVYALANLRGGGEFGEDWHKAGMLDKKQNVFDDFIAAGEYLVKEGWTAPAHLGIMGGSNGGLLVGAAMTQRPDLWGAVVCQVPLLDMLRYQLFGSGRTWVPEYGNAENEADFKWISAYSPYQKVKDGTAYPPLLMASSDHDDRVDPNHARKFVAAVQHATTSGEPVLLRIEGNAGHGGADQVSKVVETYADTYAFLFAQLGAKVPGT